VRVTQAGLLAPQQVMAGMWLVFGLAALSGVYLTWQAGWPVAVIGLASILAAIIYTGGPFPIGYYGLGELFVFLFFGLAAVVGTYFVQAGGAHPLAWWAALPMGFLSAGILVVNNLRDIETDRRAGKRTVAVRIGAQGTREEYLVCLAGAYLIPVLLWTLGLTSVWVLLAWLSLPLAYQMGQTIFREKGGALNRALAGTGRLELIFGLLFSVGLLIESLLSA
jgi:1,4-dihydroxy-2-naphthoate octaprenyltransferase